MPLPTQTTNELRELLLSTHLYYDPGAQDLRARGLAEVIAKVLYEASDHKLSFSDLQAQLCGITGASSVSDADVESGLNILRRQNDVIKRGGYWVLQQQAVRRIKQNLDTTRQRIEYILDQYFQVPVDRNSLRSWFRNAGADFFGQYSDIWVRVLANGGPVNVKKNFAPAALRASISKHGLDEHGDRLVQGYRDFLAGHQNSEVRGQIWSFAQATLSAKLVTVGLGPDPLTIRHFRDAIFLLDTNILMLSALEAARLAPAFNDFSNSIQQIGAKLHIIYPTKSEYERAIASKRTAIMKVAKALPTGVLASTNDSFLKTAIARGCLTEEDFERFVESMKLPASMTIGGTEISLKDDPELAAIAARGSGNEVKRAQISAEWQQLWGSEKRSNPVEHDAALDEVCRHWRSQGKNVWIVTADRSMQSLASKWAGATGIPSWISLDALVQILAVAGAGPGHDPQDFAPLLATIIENEMHSRDNIFRIEDLADIVDIDERIGELGKDEISAFAVRIAKLRMEGRPRNDGELINDIRRTLQRRRIEYTKEIKQLQDNLSTAEHDHDEAKARTDRAIAALTGELSLKKKRGANLRWGVALLTAILVGGALSWWGFHYWTAGNIDLGSLLIALGFGSIVLPSLFMIPVWRDAVKKAGEEAKKEALDIIVAGQTPEGILV